ncbi:hypothetical protein O6H91_17G028700 [Diphasiastrum complanatum]|uniref:Uncharacterized protein n=1 Tax=Diphasiastrum complanatum TaxID=34168 RepID=A0ACC2B688_DIPCM|nr:hypothetical protein O6H91_17G028700 [Diphasiastrum complanatum]
MAGAMLGGSRTRLLRLISTASAAASTKPSSSALINNLLLLRGFGSTSTDCVEGRLNDATLFTLSQHSSLLARRGSGVRGILTSASSSSNVEQLRGAREQVKEIINKYHCNPILVRLAWHDAGTYDKNVIEWPKCGGANGSIRFSPELNHAANAGLQNALRLLEPVKEKFPHVSFADLFQLASATAVELAGGPKIPMRYGRLDTSGPEDCAKEGKLPAAGPPNPAEHIRVVFYRMGFNDKEIVALSGAHTLGRSRPERSGWGVASTKYTKDGPGSPGGQSWTAQWLKFDNSYFKDIKEKRDKDLLVLPTDAMLFEDPSFKVYAEKYVESQDAFFEDYAKAHSKLSELGSKFQPSEGLFIDGDAT